MNVVHSFQLDGREIPFTPGQTIMDAALAARAYIPHLCHNPELPPHGSCRVCVVAVKGRHVSACTAPAVDGMEVDNGSEEVQGLRRAILQMLFVEGNHVCPACEKSGACQLQAVAYWVGMLTPHFTHFYPRRQLDASHPDFVIDFNRCILCELCVRASAEVDGKQVFALAGRGMGKHLVVNSQSGLLRDSDIAVTDKAAEVCPVGVILRKRVGFAVPVGQRRFDDRPISEQAGDFAPRRGRSLECPCSGTLERASPPEVGG